MMVDILGNLAAEFKITARGSGSSESEIDSLRALFNTAGRELPDHYLKLLSDATDLELQVKDIGYFRIWSALGAVEMNAAHELQAYLANGVAVADDGGEGVYVLMVGASGDGLYRTSFAYPDPREAVFIAASLQHLLVDGCGAARLFDWL